MSESPPPRPLSAEQRRRRRELLRQHHPDLGGDAEEFVRVLRQLGTGSPTGPGPAAGEELRFVRSPRGLARFVAWPLARLRRRRRPRRVV